MATATGVTAALNTAEERLKSLTWETNPPSTDIMRLDTHNYTQQHAKHVNYYILHSIQVILC